MYLYVCQNLNIVKVKNLVLMYMRTAYPENKEVFCERGIKNNKLFKLPSFLSSQGYLRIWFSFLLEMNSQNINVAICVLWLHATGTNSG